MGEKLKWMCRTRNVYSCTENTFRTFYHSTRYKQRFIHEQKQLQHYRQTNRPTVGAHRVESLNCSVTWNVCILCMQQRTAPTAPTALDCSEYSNSRRKSERTWFIEVLDNCQIEDMSAVVDDVVVAVLKLKMLCCLYRIIFRRRFGNRDSRFASLRPLLTMVRVYTISRRKTSLFWFIFRSLPLQFCFHFSHNKMHLPAMNTLCFISGNMKKKKNKIVVQIAS